MDFTLYVPKPMIGISQPLFKRIAGIRTPMIIGGLIRFEGRTVTERKTVEKTTVSGTKRRSPTSLTYILLSETDISILR